jgi:hypothetical protein
VSLSSHQSAHSQTCDWLTPPEWIGLLGPFDLDPCASKNQPWKTAGAEFTARGLEVPWTKQFVWLNPPYGPPKIITPWMRRLAEHGNGIACIPARTETRLWFDWVWPRAGAVLFVKGRPHFHHPITGKRAKANSGAPIALIAYGKKAVGRIEDSGIAGHMVIP